MRIRRRLKEIAGYPVAATVGSGAGYLVGYIGKIVAGANVAVRPELAKVDWLTALLAGHLHDWLFYRYGNEMSLLTAIMGAATLPIIYGLYRRCK